MTKKYLVENGVLVNAPCCCSVCDTEIQPGHRFCNTPTQELLDLESEGKIYRDLDYSGWKWLVVEFE